MKKVGKEKMLLFEEDVRELLNYENIEGYELRTPLTEPIEDKKGHRNLRKKLMTSFKPEFRLQTEVTPQAYAEVVVHSVKVLDANVTEVFLSTVEQAHYHDDINTNPKTVTHEFLVKLAVCYNNNWYTVQLLYNLTSKQQKLIYKGAQVLHCGSSFCPAKDLHKLSMKFQDPSYFTMDVSTRAVSYF